MKPIPILLSTLALCLGCATPGCAQIPVPPPAPQPQLLSSAALDQMLGPIALYPDPLLAQILPAATLPSEIVLADRYINSGGDPNQVAQQGWAPSVQALAEYPALLKWLDDNLAWTTALGQAFLYQQQDVMDSIQRLRAQAQALGNLQSTSQETVVNDEGDIEILPANPEVIYVPVYQPQVVYYQAPTFGAPYISFGVGLTVGAWLNHDFDWHAHQLIVWRGDHPRPADWWSRRPHDRPPPEQAHATVWRPRNPPGLASRNVDRGWAQRPAESTVTFIGTQAGQGQRRPASAPPAQRAAPAPVQRAPQAPQQNHARPASGALIGIESARQTHQDSARGQASRQAISRPAPAAARPAPAPARPAAPARSAPPTRSPSPSGAGRR